MNVPTEADGSYFSACRVHENVNIAQDIWRMRFAFPELAARVRPGQFFMVRLADTHDPLIGRAFALYDTVASDDGPWGVDFAYIVKGNLTSRLCTLRAGDRLEVWGPLGNGFAPATADRLVMVAGGIGYTPFLAVAKANLRVATYGDQIHEGSPPQVSFCYGAAECSQSGRRRGFRRTGCRSAFGNRRRIARASRSGDGSPWRTCCRAAAAVSRFIAVAPSR